MTAKKKTKYGVFEGDLYYARIFEDNIDDSDCLLYPSDAADEQSSIDLGGRRHLKKKKQLHSK